MAKIAQMMKGYPSDLTDEEWAMIAPLIPKPRRRDRPRKVEFRGNYQGVAADRTDAGAGPSGRVGDRGALRRGDSADSLVGWAVKILSV